MHKKIEEIIHLIKKNTLFYTIDYDAKLTDPNGLDFSEFELAYLFLELKNKYQIKFSSKDLEDGKLNSVNGIASVAKRKQNCVK
ncbi:MAG: hypothetical protein ACOYEG_10965 [Petrimonas sp.]|jgi:acyl carrier protein